MVVKKKHLLLLLSTKKKSLDCSHKKFSRKVRIYMGDKMYVFKKSLSFVVIFGRFVVPSNNFRITLEKQGQAWDLDYV